MKCLLFLLGGLSVIQLTHCTQLLPDCIEIRYRFEVPFVAYPDDAILKLHDTMYFEFNCPKKLVDVESGEIINYDKAENFITSVYFGEFRDSQRFELDPGSFGLVIKRGKEYFINDGVIRKNFIPEETDKNYRLLVGLIPQKTGKFTVLFVSPTKVHRSSDKCTKATFQLRYENTDQHYELSPYFKPNEPFTPGTDYYFEVK